jgi:hypothetical protein
MGAQQGGHVGAKVVIVARRQISPERGRSLAGLLRRSFVKRAGERQEGIAVLRGDDWNMRPIPGFEFVSGAW